MLSRIHLKALAVIVGGTAVYLTSPPPAEGAAFSCPISTCITNGVCPLDMAAWCESTGCTTTIYNCGPLFNCTDNKVLFYCGTNPGS